MIKTLRMAVKNRRVESFVVSFPKTGRTWLRVMLGRMLVDGFNVPERLMLSTYKATRLARLGPVMFSHGGPFHLLEDVGFDQLRFDERVFGGKRIVFLVRDIRDTLVSFYFQQGKREKVFDGDISRFIRDPRFGAAKVVAFYTWWFRSQSVASAFLPVRYEQLRAEPVRMLGEVAEFLRWEVDEQVLHRAVEYGSFENMRSMERKGQFDRKMMKPGDPNDVESFKVRKGKVGGFVEYLNADDLSYIDAVIADHGAADCNWYLAAPAPDQASTISAQS